MFTVLTTRDYTDKGLVFKIKNINKINKIETRVTGNGKNKFAELSIPINKKGINWRKVYSIVEKNKRAIITEKGINFPELYDIKPYQNNDFKKVVLVNTLCNIIDDCSIPLYARNIGIVDISGKNKELTKKLALHCMNVKILTDDKVGYNKLRNELINEYGIVTSFYSGTYFTNDNILVVLLDKLCVNVKINKDIPIFSYENVDMDNHKKVLYAKSLDDCEVFENIPKTINNLDFAQALWGINKVKNLSNCTCEKFICNENIIDKSTFISYINDRFLKMQNK